MIENLRGGKVSWEERNEWMDGRESIEEGKREWGKEGRKVRKSWEEIEREKWE